MKKKIFIILIMTGLLTSCSMKPKEAGINQEVVHSTTPIATAIPVNKLYDAITYFDNEDTLSEPLTKDGKLPDVVCLDANVTKNKKDEFIRYYLEERGMLKDKPDGVSNYNGKSIVKYFTNKNDSKICFIVSTLDMMPGYEGTFCMTLNMNDMKKVGYLDYSFDSKDHTYNERLYDIDWKQAATITYRYRPNVPFPLITKYKDMNQYRDTIGDELFRGQKFWLYDKIASFDKSGKWIGYAGDIYAPDEIKSQNVCLYDKSGKLKKIECKLSNADVENNYSEESQAEYKGTDKTSIQLSYAKNGKIDTLEYSHNSMIYGTTGSSGEIKYDESGRMIYEDSYVTHGTTYNYYLYHGNEKKPWACIYVDSMPWSGTKKNGIEYEYGNPYSISLYQTVNKN